MKNFVLKIQLLIAWALQDHILVVMSACDPASLTSDPITTQRGQTVSLASFVKDLTGCVVDNWAVAPMLSGMSLDAASGQLTWDPPANDAHWLGAADQKAMAEEGATFSVVDGLDGSWNQDIKLFSSNGFHNAYQEPSEYLSRLSIFIDFGQERTVNKLYLQKRGDGCCQERIIHSFKLRYKTTQSTDAGYCQFSRIRDHCISDQDHFGPYSGYVSNCEAECNKNTECKSFDYNYADLKCYLSRVNSPGTSCRGKNLHVKSTADCSWYDYNNLDYVATGALSGDEHDLVREISFDPFVASKVEILLPSEINMDDNTVQGRLDFGLEHPDNRVYMKDSAAISLTIGGTVYPLNSVITVTECRDLVTFDSGIQSTYYVQIGDTLTFQVSATITQNAKCTLPGSGYTLNPVDSPLTDNDITIEDVSISTADGKITVDTASKKGTTKFKVQVMGKSSPEFRIIVFTCLDFITFPNLAPSYLAILGSAPPAIDPVSVTTDSVNCPLNTANNNCVPSSEIVLDTSGSSPTFTVTADAYLPETIFTVSFVIGLETMSQSFTYEILSCASYVTFAMPQSRFKSKTSEPFPSTVVAATTTNTDHCNLGVYSAVEAGTSSLPTGVTFDTTSAAFTVATSSVFSEKLIQVTVQVGTIFVTSAQFTLEVYECIITWSLLPMYNYQVAQTSSITQYAASNSFVNCDISGYSAQYTFTGLGSLQSADILDTSTGIISFDTGTQAANAIVMSQSGIRLTIRIDTEDFTSNTFGFTIFDCDPVIDWVPVTDISTQMATSAQTFSAMAFSVDASCPITTGAHVAYLVDDSLTATLADDSLLTATYPDTQIISMNNYGVFTVQTGAAFDLRIYVRVTIGSQIFTSEQFHAVVFDCSSAISFTGIPGSKVALFVGDLPPSLAVSATGTALCAVTSSSFTATGLTTGISMDVNGNFNILTTVSVSLTQIDISVSSGTQIVTAAVNFEFEVLDCSSFVTFNSLPPGKTFLAQVGGSFPSIDTTTTVASQRTTDCAVGSSSYTLSSAIAGVALSARGVFTIQTGSVIPQTQVTISVTCGSTGTVSSNVITLQVYSCATPVTFPALNDIRYQLGAPNVLPIATATTSDTVQCDILPNQHTTTAALPAGLTMTGEGVFSTDGRSIPETSVTVKVQVGTEFFSSNPFTFEVFDCTSSINWPNLPSQKLQVRSEVPYATAATQTTNPTDCPIGDHSYSGLVTGIDITKSGTIQIDMKKAIAQTTLQGSVIVGSQTIMQVASFTFELFDCQTKMTASSLNNIEQQVNTTLPEMILTVSSSENTDCPIGTLMTDNQNVNIAQTGEISIENTQNIPQTTVRVQMTTGVQTFEIASFDLRIVDCDGTENWAHFIDWNFLLQDSGTFRFPETGPMVSFSSPVCIINYYEKINFPSDDIVSFNTSDGSYIVYTSKFYAPPPSIELGLSNIIIHVGTQKIPGKGFIFQIGCNDAAGLQVNPLIPINEYQYGRSFSWRMISILSEKPGACPIEKYEIIGGEEFPNTTIPDWFNSKNGLNGVQNYLSSKGKVVNYIEASTEGTVQKIVSFLIRTFLKGGETFQDFGPYTLSICPNKCKANWTELIDSSNLATIGTVSIERNKTGEVALVDLDHWAGMNQKRCRFVTASLAEDDEYFWRVTNLVAGSNDNPFRLTFVFDSSEMWTNETISLAFQTPDNCYQQNMVFKVDVNLTGEILLDTGGEKVVKFENEVPEEHYVILQKQNRINLGPWAVMSGKAKLSEKHKRFVKAEVKVTTATEVKSYAGIEILKKVFSETLSLEKIPELIIKSDLTDLDIRFGHSSVDLELQLQYLDQQKQTVSTTLIIVSESYLEAINTMNETKVVKSNFKPPPVFVINEDIGGPEPSIRLKPIRSEGPNFRLIFNQNMTKPVRSATFDYSKVFSLKVMGADGETEIKGEFVRFAEIQQEKIVPNNQSRKLQVREGEINQEFKWYVEEHKTGEEILIGLAFQKPEAVSDSGHGSDQLVIEFSDYRYFKSDLSNKTIDPEQYQNLPMRSIPLLPKYPQQVKSVKRASKSVGVTVAGGAIVSAMVSLLLGTGLSLIWSLLNTLQLIVFGYLIQVQFPSEVAAFYEACLFMARIDLYDMSGWYEENFDFIETYPFNERFETFGADTMNFMYNSGSITYFVGMLILNFIVRKVLFKVALVKYKSQFWRRVGMRYQEGNFFAESVRMLFELYLDLFLAVILGSIEMYKSGRSFEDNFGPHGYNLNTVCILVIGVVCVLFPFIVSTHLYKNFEKLEEEAFQENYECLYEDLRTDSKLSAFYLMYFTFRRMLYIIVFTFGSEYNVIQVLVMLVLCVINLVYLCGNKPFSDRQTNKDEILNELVVYICCLANLVFVNIGLPMSFRRQIGLFMIGVCLLNLVFGLLVIIKGSILETKDEMMTIIENMKQSQESNIKIKRAQEIIGKEGFRHKIWKYTIAAANNEKNQEVEEINEARLFLLRTQAVKFSKKWLPQRKWLKENDFTKEQIDELPEEIEWKDIYVAAKLKEIQLMKQNRVEKEKQKKAAEEQERSVIINRLTQEHFQKTEEAQKAIRNCSASNEEFKKTDYVIDETGRLKFKKTFMRRAYGKVDIKMKQLKNKSKQNKMGSIKEEDHEETERVATEESQVLKLPSSQNLALLISHDAVKRAVAQKKEQIIEHVMNDPKKYLSRDLNTDLSLTRMTNQREQGLVERKVKESMDNVYKRGFNVLEFDYVAHELVDKNQRKERR